MISKVSLNMKGYKSFVKLQERNSFKNMCLVSNFLTISSYLNLFFPKEFVSFLMQQFNLWKNDISNHKVVLNSETRFPISGLMSAKVQNSIKH